MKSHKDHEFNSVTLALNLSAKTNEILSRTAARSGRTKRQEALLRLEDHLNEFVDIASAGKRFAR